jgi:hypothetical protein
MEQGADHAHHIRAATKMFRFIEGAISFANNLAKMGKMNARSEFVDHREQIIVRPCTI